MTPEAQRIAIAEACGWHSPRTGPYGHLYMFNGNDACGSIPPNYLTDLNAIHEAEKVLTEKQQAIYVSVLWDIVRGFKPDADPYVSGYWEVPTDSVFAHLHANAAQRAEALLRTLNLWREEA